MQNRNPLSPKEIMEDISHEHANKTVTVEAHPHLSIQCASIHPCKHSSIMRLIVQRLLDSGRQPDVSRYLFYFLKFISAVIPTVEYDFTIDTQT